MLHSPIFWTILVLAIIVRITAPRIILQQTNKFLADFSPVCAGHLDDLNLGIIRGAYELRGFELWIKGENVERFKEQAKKDTKQATAKIFPVKIERVVVTNSNFEFAEVISLPEAKRWRLTDIQGRASNLTPSENSPRTIATLQGKLFNQAVVRAVSNLNLLKTPPVWDIDLELKDFQLPNANCVLKDKLPLTITKGTFDLYAEAISAPNGIEGYAKPFLKKVDIVADKENFKGFKDEIPEGLDEEISIPNSNQKGKTL